MILVLTPLLIEQEALRKALGKPERTMELGEQTVTFFPRDVVTSIGGHGKVQFALTTQMLVNALSPKLVICAGACGALTKSVALTDVIVADQTIEHDYNLRFIQRPLPHFAGDGQFLAEIRRMPSPAFALHFGPVASGDEDVLDVARAQQIRDLTGAMAVAWEGAGGARAAKFCETPFLEIRTVTDTADVHAPRDFAANIEQGMRHIGQVLDHLSRCF
jgi:adenosylhomocysteine nucleosidase